MSIATKIFIAVAGLVVVLALVSKGGSLTNNADATVDIALNDSTTVDAAREQITSAATSSWQATRIAETSESDDEATIEFALPGTSLDGFINALRRQGDAESVEVSLEVDPDQVEPGPLASDTGTDSKPAPVKVQVNLSTTRSQGPLVTFIGALLVAAVAAVALGLVWRRFRPAEIDTIDVTGSDNSEPRRWTNRP